MPKSDTSRNSNANILHREMKVKNQNNQLKDEMTLFEERETGKGQGGDTVSSVSLQNLQGFYRII